MNNCAARGQIIQIAQEDFRICLPKLVTLHVSAENRNSNEVISVAAITVASTTRSILDDDVLTLFVTNSKLADLAANKLVVIIHLPGALRHTNFYVLPVGPVADRLASLDSQRIYKNRRCTTPPD